MIESIAEPVKAYRARHSLSQADLAARWSVPVSTVRGWEAGKRPAQPAMIATLIGEALGQA